MATTRYSGHFFDFRRKMSFLNGAKKVTKSRDNGISLRKQTRILGTNWYKMRVFWYTVNSEYLDF